MLHASQARIGTVVAGGVHTYKRCAVVGETATGLRFAFGGGVEATLPKCYLRRAGVVLSVPKWWVYSNKLGVYFR